MLQRKARGEKISVGVNKYVEQGPGPAFGVHASDPAVAARQLMRLEAVKAGRDSVRVQALLSELKHQAATDANLMPITLELVSAYATLGEIVAALKDVWGVYRES